METENLKFRDDFLLSGDGVFHTIQGEGDMVGVPTTFIRLHYCNLNCQWCDTPYTWDKNDERFYNEPFHMSIEELEEEIRQSQTEKGVETFIPHIAFTGGEPLLQQSQIVKFIRQNIDYHYQIETNGTIEPCEELIEYAERGIVKFNCSPKMSNSGIDIKRTLRPEVLRILNSIPTTIFKFVSATEEDIEEIENVFLPYISREKVMVMPEGISEESNNTHLQQMIDIILRKRFRVTPRLQITLFKNKRKT
jgi:organic radical activating enzyme